MEVCACGVDVGREVPGEVSHLGSLPGTTRAEATIVPPATRAGPRSARPRSLVVPLPHSQVRDTTSIQPGQDLAQHRLRHVAELEPIAARAHDRAPGLAI